MVSTGNNNAGFYQAYGFLNMHFKIKNMFEQIGIHILDVLEMENGERKRVFIKQPRLEVIQLLYSLGLSIFYFWYFFFQI